MTEKFKKVSFKEAVVAYAAMKYYEKGCIVAACVDESGLRTSTWTHLIAAWASAKEYNGDTMEKRKIFAQVVNARLKEEWCMNHPE